MQGPAGVDPSGAISEVKMKKIAGMDYLDRRETAAFLGVGLSTLDTLTRRSRKGGLVPPLPFFQLRANGPIFYSKERLESWVQKRTK